MIILQVTPDELTVIIKNAVRDTMPEDLKTSTPQPPIKGIHALAKFLGVSAPRAQKLKNENVFPFFQDGRLVLFDPDKVREAMTGYNKKKVRG